MDSDEHVRQAADMVSKGDGDLLMPRDAWDSPITAYRYHSLSGRLTEDDMFSNDLTENELRSIFAPVVCRSLWVVSTGDEYVPANVDACALAARLSSACPGRSSVARYEGANHALSNAPEHAARFAREVAQFTTECICSP
eukprot:Opistho-1_new@71484